jgi:hypothetical protein
VGSDSVDAHQRTHTVVAVDEVGRKLGERTVAATPEGHLEAVRWAAEWPDRRFALEDCRHVTRRFEADLLAAGEQVVRVPTRRMAGERRGGRERGKADLYARLLVASFPTGKTGGGRGERGGGNRASSPDFRPFFRLALAVDAGAAAPPYACKPVCSRSRQTSGSTRA